MLKKAKGATSAQRTRKNSHTAPLHIVEPISKHMLLRHVDDDRSQQRPPHSWAPCRQQVLPARQASSGPQTARPQAVEPLGTHRPPRQSCVAELQHADDPQHCSSAVQQLLAPHMRALLQQRRPPQQTSSSLQHTAFCVGPHSWLAVHSDSHE